VRKAFNEVYLHLYGRVFDQLELEIMNLRVRAVAPGRRFVEQSGAKAATAAEDAEGSREAYCPVVGDFVPHK